MEKIILFDTSVGSCNKGDDIIMESCMRQLGRILDEKFVFRVPTHTPMSHWYQNFSKFNVGDYFKDVKYKFMCGTNMLNSNVCIPTPLWNANIFNCKIAQGVVLVGVGLGSSSCTPNLYTKMFYKKVLSHNYIHSTRDEKSAEFLRSMGFQALNTGCVTTWGLTNEFCKKIVKNKSDKVVFTLTDYKKDKEKDCLFVQTLLDNYDEAFFWIQGAGDYEYLKELGYLDKVKLISPELAAYETILKQDIDYIGTRLHAGIKALQELRRTLILSVDNRAEDMSRDFELPIIVRGDMKRLNEMIYAEYSVQPNIKIENIKRWLAQFQ